MSVFYAAKALSKSGLWPLHRGWYRPFFIQSAKISADRLVQNAGDYLFLLFKL